MHIMLILTFSLGAQPRLVERPLNSLSACLTGTGVQVEAARWLEEHPSYTFIGWKCEIGSRRELKA
jgi:hypothetical protein